MDDYHNLLQKIAELETKIHRLEVNGEINGQYGNESTLLISQNSERFEAFLFCLFFPFVFPHA